MTLKFELVFRALQRSKSFNLIFIANFALAILSLFFLLFFKGSVEGSLESKAKTLLGADISVTSRFPISLDQENEILKLLPPTQKVHKGISTISMISSKDRGRLMEVVRLQKGFPFYGGISFQNETSTFPENNILPKEDEVWVYDEVLKLLGLERGDFIKIGSQEFRIDKVVNFDSAKSISFSGFIPRVYLSQSGIKRSRLLQFGSTAKYKLDYKLTKSLENEELEKIENDLEKVLDQNLNVLSPNDGRDRLTRVLRYITDFLSLVSLVSFFLGLVGLIYLYTGFLNKHKKDIKVLKDLGLSHNTIYQSYIIHLLSLVSLSAIFVFSLVSIIVPLMGPFLTKTLGFSFSFQSDYLFFMKAAAALIVLSISVGIPLLKPLVDNKPQSAGASVLSFTPFIIALFFLTNLVTPVQNIGLIFAITLFAIILIVFMSGNIFLNTIDFSGHLKKLSFSLAMKNIVRQKKTTLTLFTAIFLCSSLFSLIPQVGSSLKKALELGADGKPRFFVLDALESDIENLSSEINHAGARLENISPMIRARITKINDIDFKTYSKEHGDQSSKAADELKNRTVNISYRKTLKKSESIIEGADFSGKYNESAQKGIAELSVEQRYANKRGIKLFDQITFDILGLEVQAKVVNIRSVKWTEFVPNFFLIFQDGIINDAPNKILATISEGPYDPQELILSLSDKFPSLTIIDVKSLFDEFAKLADSVTSIADNMSIYSILIGLIMSFIIIQYQMNLQTNNILRLKMIGIENKSLKHSLLIEFTLVSVVASILGIIIGSCSSYVVSRVLFESFWDFRPKLLILYFLMIPGLTVLIVSYFTNKILNQKENKLFGE